MVTRQRVGGRVRSAAEVYRGRRRRRYGAGVDRGV